MNKITKKVLIDTEPIINKPRLERQRAECERCRYHQGPCKRMLTREQLLDRYNRMLERQKRLEDMSDPPAMMMDISL